MTRIGSAGTGIGFAIVPVGGTEVSRSAVVAVVGMKSTSGVDVAAIACAAAVAAAAVLHTSLSIVDTAHYRFDFEVERLVRKKSM
jgi:hypothetical protein